MFRSKSLYKKCVKKSTGNNFFERLNRRQPRKAAFAPQNLQMFKFGKRKQKERVAIATLSFWLKLVKQLSSDKILFIHLQYLVFNISL